MLAGIGVYLWVHSLNRVSTDDAQVDGHIIPISPKIYGKVLEVLVDDNQQVKQGQVLVRIDPRDYQAKVDQAQAAVAVAESQALGANAGRASHSRYHGQQRYGGRSAVERRASRLRSGASGIRARRHRRYRRGARQRGDRAGHRGPRASGSEPHEDARGQRRNLAPGVRFLRFASTGGPQSIASGQGQAGVRNQGRRNKEGRSAVGASPDRASAGRHPAGQGHSKAGAGPGGGRFLRRREHCARRTPTWKPPNWISAIRPLWRRWMAW